MNSALFLSLVFAHVVADFYLQSDRLCEQKEARRARSWFLYVHALIVGAVTWAFVPVGSFGPYVLAITLSHGVIDLVKAYAPQGVWNFVLDQLAHVGVLLAVAATATVAAPLPLQAIDVSTAFSLPRFLLAAFLCVKPANILIKLVLRKYKIGETPSCESIKNAGALIGNLERLLTVIFVIIGRYDAIGFIIAAKSLLRFKDTDTAKTEYVLAGTFLSFGFALLCGLMAA